MCLLGEPTLTPPAAIHPRQPQERERKRRALWFSMSFSSSILFHVFTISSFAPTPCACHQRHKGDEENKDGGESLDSLVPLSGLVGSSSVPWKDPNSTNPMPTLEDRCQGLLPHRSPGTLFKDTFFPVPWELLVSQQQSLGASEWSPSRHSPEWLCLFELELPGPLKRERGQGLGGWWYPQL